MNILCGREIIHVDPIFIIYLLLELLCSFGVEVYMTGDVANPWLTHFKLQMFDNSQQKLRYKIVTQG